MRKMGGDLDHSLDGYIRLTAAIVRQACLDGCPWKIKVVADMEKANELMYPKPKSRKTIKGKNKPNTPRSAWKKTSRWHMVGIRDADGSVILRRRKPVMADAVEFLDEMKSTRFYAAVVEWWENPTDTFERAVAPKLSFRREPRIAGEDAPEEA